jgi:uncharacterized BrkB/YihY/UPF0761 family membrane protein
VLLFGALGTLFAALVVGSFGVAVLKRYAPGFTGNELVSYATSVAISTLGVFAFSVAVYQLLTNERLRVVEVLPGALLATLVLQVSFQVLPVYVRYSNVNPVLKTFGSPAILLVWLYVMANVIVFGAELNWWRRYGREGQTADAQPRDEVPGLA